MTFGTTAVSSLAIGHYSFPYSKTWSPLSPLSSLSPLLPKTPKEYPQSIPMSTIASISLCSTFGVFYLKGFGFADIAYATRRSVATLTSALDNAKKVF